MRNGRHLFIAAAILAMAFAGSGCGKLRESRAENLRRSALEHYAKRDPDKALEISEIAIRLGADGVNLRGMRGSILMQQQQPEKALSEFEDGIVLATAAIPGQEVELPTGMIALELKDLYISRGSALQVLGRYQECLASYEKAVEADETAVWALNNIAWLLATGPDDSIRDSERAVESATKACELTEWENPAILDTLAAAYAEAGDFKSAVKWQTEAGVHLDTRDTKNQAGFAERLQLYSEEKVFREDPAEKYRDDS